MGESSRLKHEINGSSSGNSNGIKNKKKGIGRWGKNNSVIIYILFVPKYYQKSTILRLLSRGLLLLP